MPPWQMYPCTVELKPRRTPNPAVAGIFDRAPKWYWTKGPGLRKWITNPHPWTTLYNHLAKHMNPTMAKRVTSQWFHDTTGLWSGERKGRNPAGRG